MLSTRRVAYGLAGVLGALLLNGCIFIAKDGGKTTVSGTSMGRYQMAISPAEEAPGGVIFKIDTLNGDMWANQYDAGGNLRDSWQKMRLDVK